MKVLVDACVLYPTVLREIILGCASTGLFTPLWSKRILEEWRHAACRETPIALVEAELANVSARFPAAIVEAPMSIENTLSLPDENDRHVLAAAMEGGADTLLTLNMKDFPTRTLARHDIMPRHPDSLLTEMYSDNSQVVAGQVGRVLEAVVPDMRDMTPRAILKRSRLPRLAKALYATAR